MGRRRKDGAAQKSSEKTKAPKPRKKTEAAKAKLVEDAAKFNEDDDGEEVPIGGGEQEDHEKWEEKGFQR